MIDVSLALASQQRGKALGGYYFLDVTEGPSGPFNYASQFGLSAYPGPFSGIGGRNCFLVNESGRVYMRDAGAIPGYGHDQLRRGEVPEALRKWPADLEAEGWVPAWE